MTGVTDLPASTPLTGPLTRLYLLALCIPRPTAISVCGSGYSAPPGVVHFIASTSLALPGTRWAGVDLGLAAELSPSFPPQAGWLRVRGGTGLRTFQDSRALCKAGPPPSPLPFPQKCRCEARQAGRQPVASFLGMKSKSVLDC